MKRLFALPLLLLSLISCSLLDEDTPNPNPGNNTPTVTLTASPPSGVAPLEVTFTAVGNDVDGDDLSYSWSLAGAANAPTASQTFTEAGSYPVTVTVSDGQTSGSASTTVTVTAEGPVEPEPPTDPNPNPGVALTVKASAGGPVPWGVTYELSASSSPTGSSFSVTCAGRDATNLSARNDIELEAENVFSCIHLALGEAVVATLTGADGAVLAQVEQAADVAPSTGVPFGGAWEYYGQTGDTFLETANFTVTEAVDEATGQGSGGHFQDLLMDYPEYPAPRPTTFTLSARGNTLTVTGPPTFPRELIFTGPVAGEIYGNKSYQGAQVFMAPNTQEVDSNQGFLYTAD